MGQFQGPETFFCKQATTIASFLGKKIKFQITRMADILDQMQISVPEPGEIFFVGNFFAKFQKVVLIGNGA